MKFLVTVNFIKLIKLGMGNGGGKVTGYYKYNKQAYYLNLFLVQQLNL